MPRGKIRKQSHRIRSDVIQERCRSRGWEYKTLAEKARLDAKTVSNALAGAKLEIKTISKIANALGIECDDLIVDERPQHTLALEQLQNDPAFNQIDVVVQASGTLGQVNDAALFQQAIKTLTDALAKSGVRLVSLKCQVVKRPEQQFDDINEGQCVYYSRYATAARRVVIARGRFNDQRPFWAYVEIQANSIESLVDECERNKLNTYSIEKFGQVILSAEGVEPPSWLTQKIIALYPPEPPARPVRSHAVSPT